MKAFKNLFLPLILSLLTVRCVSTKKVYRAVQTVQTQVTALSRQVAKVDSTYNAQQLIKYRYEIKAIDDRYKKGFTSDSALLYHFKLLGRPGSPR